ncbi:MAG: hypothetical protein EOO74_04760, partial [Myxococcales bacterium]
MATWVTGLFYNYVRANATVDALLRQGYQQKDVSLIMSEATRAKEFGHEENGNKALEGAGVGASVGGTVGAVVAAIAAVGTTLAIPGLGLFIAGPIAAGLAGAGAGGAVGGLVGGLVGAGIPKSRAELYEEGLKKGGIVVGVQVANDEEGTRIEKMLEEMGAEKIKSLAHRAGRSTLEEGVAMKLYWGPHTCAIGIHILLEEIGRPYELEELDVAGGEAEKPPFLAINPKGKVPTLVRNDGSVLTEFGAIATWLAHTHPEKGLLPTDVEGATRAHEILAYVEGTVHGQGFTRLFKPAFFEPQDVVHTTLGVGQSKVKQQGRELIEKGFAILDRQLGATRTDESLYAVGPSLSIADAALFYVERWAPQMDV